jgi:hypothetical protein
MLSYWDNPRALRAVVVILGTALHAVLRRILALPKVRTVWILVADVALFRAFFKAVAR